MMHVHVYDFYDAASCFIFIFGFVPFLCVVFLFKF